MKRKLGLIPVETACVNYTLADKMLSSGEGWRLSKLEDRNRVVGMVYLERDALFNGSERP